MRKPSTSTAILRLRVRSRRSWSSWLLSRASRRLEKERRRTALLDLAHRDSLLRQKELGQLILQQEHRLQELLPPQAGKALEPGPELPPELRLQPAVSSEELRRRLGLE